MRKIFIICISLFTSFTTVAQEKKIEFTGAARGYIFNDQLNGNITETDTTHKRNLNRGYTLLDLGVVIKPIRNTEIYSIIRFRSEFGGFYGGGASALLRQLRIKGVIGNFLKYQVGDIYLKLTPYTFWNYQEEGQVNEAEVFNMYRRVIHYENFYLDNNWRVQGAQTSFGFSFSKFVNEINFNGFITKNRGINWNGSRMPERYFGGGRIGIVQSKFLSIGGNATSLFSIPTTVINNVPDIYTNNTVVSGDYTLTTRLDSTVLSLGGEVGKSTVQYKNIPSALEPKRDHFWETSITADFKKVGIILKGTFRDVGQDFISAAAQTKRINFSTVSSIFPTLGNERMMREVTAFDIARDETIYNQKIGDSLMRYNPIYSNMQPYGNATPNRRGGTLEAKLEKGAIAIFANGSYHKEIIGTGTPVLKEFTQVRLGATLNIDEWIDFEKSIKVTGGAQIENAKRDGDEIEKVNFNTSLIDAGLEVEVLKNLDLLGGLKQLSAKGNEFLTSRNYTNSIQSFSRMDYDLKQTIYAG